MRFTNLLREEKGWVTRSTTTHFADKHLAVVTELVETPTHSEPRPWTTVRRKAAVVFTVAELSRMIAANEIRDSNTLSICARMAACGFFSFGAQG